MDPVFSTNSETLTTPVHHDFGKVAKLIRCNQIILARLMKGIMMNSKWVLTLCTIGIISIAQTANGQLNCGCDSGDYTKTRSVCQGYTQARAEALWGGYCGEKCWGELGDDSSCGFGDRVRGMFASGANCGCNGGGFGWANCNSGSCGGDCGTGCGGFSLPSFKSLRLGCGNRCGRDLLAGFRGFSLKGCGSGCKTSCDSGCDTGCADSCGRKGIGLRINCGCGGGLQLLSRCGNRCNDGCKDSCGIGSTLRGMFQRSGYGCCDSGADQSNAPQPSGAEVEPTPQASESDK